MTTKELRLVKMAPELLRALKGLVHAEKRYSKETGLKTDDPIAEAVLIAETVIKKIETEDAK